MGKRPLQLLDVRIPDGRKYGAWAGEAISVLLNYRERPVRIREFYGRGVQVPTRTVDQPATRKYILRQARLIMEELRQSRRSA